MQQLLFQHLGILPHLPNACMVIINNYINWNGAIHKLKFKECENIIRKITNDREGSAPKENRVVISILFSVDWIETIPWKHASTCTCTCFLQNVIQDSIM